MEISLIDGGPIIKCFGYLWHDSRSRFYWFDRMIILSTHSFGVVLLTIRTERKVLMRAHNRVMVIIAVMAIGARHRELRFQFGHNINLVTGSLEQG